MASKFSNPPNQSKGILEDHAVRKVLQAIEGYFKNLKIGDHQGSDFLDVGDNGSIGFNGTARIIWKKITADSVTVAGFTAVGQVVGDLQTANDGNVYTLTEVAGGGNNIIVDFINVTAFNWVKILGSYGGSSTHGIYIEVYNYTTTSWDQFDCFQKQFTDSGALYCNSDFFIPSDSNYIDSGNVRVRFNHSSATVNNHLLYLDEVSLQQ